MKYCAFCGTELPDYAIFCSKCGKSLQAEQDNSRFEHTDNYDFSMKEYKENEKLSEKRSATNGKILGWIGIICSILGFLAGWYLSLAGLVLGIVGINIDKTGETARLNRAAIIISVISFIVEILLLVFLGKMGFSIFNQAVNSIPK